MEFAENFDIDTQTIQVERLVRDEETDMIHKVPWVTVRPSTIVGAGLGAFADRNFKEGDILGYYVGAVEEREYGTGDYLMDISEELVVNGAKGGNWTRKINDGSRRANKTWKKSKVNAVFYHDLELRAHKNIRKGSEIFVYYGKSYWEETK